jgi:hypothetical protein
MKISIDSVQSVSIRNEYIAAHCNHADFFGSFRHPDHPDSQDWLVTLYSVCDELVFETNGDPVWASMSENFEAIAVEYGIDVAKVRSEEVGK